MTKLVSLNIDRVALLPLSQMLQAIGNSKNLLERKRLVWLSRIPCSIMFRTYLAAPQHWALKT